MKRLHALALTISILSLMGIMTFALPAGANASQNSSLFSDYSKLTINESVVAFGGKTWWVIGNATGGVWPQQNSVTLLQKEISNEDEGVPFRVGQHDDPGDGSLIEHWVHNHDGSPSYTSIGTEAGTVNIPTMDYFVANPEGMAAWSSPNEYLGSTLQQKLTSDASQLPTAEQTIINPRTFVGGGVYNAPSADEIIGPSVENQLMWALSGQEMLQIGNSTVRSYGSDWWLRGISESVRPAGFNTGSTGGWGVGSTGGNWIIDNCRADTHSVRAAVSLNLSNALFASSASAEGKSSVTVGTGFNTMGSLLTDADHPVKFTVIDNGLKLEVVATMEQSTQSASTLEFSYSDASTGSNMYLSGILTDADGNVVYYGKLADLSSADSGSLSIPLSGVANGTYTLSLFTEQANGDLYTDFCSTPITMTVTVANGIGTVSNFNGTILHEHAWSSNWASDDNYHWHECTADNCPITENADKEGYAAHTPSDEWSSNSESHWRTCTVCGAPIEAASHTYTWVVDREATATKAGLKHKECTVCGYALDSVEIPASGQGDKKPSSESSATASKDAQALPNTGDYQMLAIATVMIVGIGALGTSLMLRRKCHH